jgi:hypothetical protein
MCIVKWAVIQICSCLQSCEQHWRYIHVHSQMGSITVIFIFAVNWAALYSLKWAVLQLYSCVQSTKQYCTYYSCFHLSEQYYSYFHVSTQVSSTTARLMLSHLHSIADTCILLHIINCALVHLSSCLQSSEQ